MHASTIHDRHMKVGSGVFLPHAVERAVAVTPKTQNIETGGIGIGLSRYSMSAA